MINSGETTNKVPDLAVFKFNIRIEAADDARWCTQHLDTLISQYNTHEGYKVELHGGFGRMPKRLDSQHLALYSLVQEYSKQLNRPLTYAATGGCCDGNNLAAAGLPNVDTLGVRGDFIHSHNEYIQLPSLTDRAQLSALLLLHIAQHGLPFKQSRTGDIK